MIHIVRKNKETAVFLKDVRKSQEILIIYGNEFFDVQKTTLHIAVFLFFVPVLESS